MGESSGEKREEGPDEVYNAEKLWEFLYEYSGFDDLPIVVVEGTGFSSSAGVGDDKLSLAAVRGKARRKRISRSEERSSRRGREEERVQGNTEGREGTPDSSISACLREVAEASQVAREERQRERGGGEAAAKRGTRAMGGSDDFVYEEDDRIPPSQPSAVSASPVGSPSRERRREREREKEVDREKERERRKERGRESDKEKERKTDREGRTPKHRESEKEGQGEGEWKDEYESGRRHRSREGKEKKKRTEEEGGLKYNRGMTDEEEGERTNKRKGEKEKSSNSYTSSSPASTHLPNSPVRGRATGSEYEASSAGGTTRSLALMPKDNEEREGGQRRGWGVEGKETEFENTGDAEGEGTTRRVWGAHGDKEASPAPHSGPSSFFPAPASDSLTKFHSQTGGGPGEAEEEDEEEEEIEEGDLQLRDCIGEGAFGSVYRALDARNGNLVAVKVVSLLQTAAPSVGADWKSATAGTATRECRSLMAEINTLKELRHPNIVRYLGCFERNFPERRERQVNIVMEFVPGGTLRQLATSGGRGLRENLVRLYTKQLLEGLAFVHERHIIHRETSAQQCQSARGTPLWMPPEVFEARPYSFPADIWSLGCTVMEMLTGENPWTELGFTGTAVLFALCGVGQAG
uniref:Protein kinase domain-containing protein n=1 Tax=Chromera velia CCMP2878 TaxID=1169474 RepID=A0A0G4H2I3_9ALVE|eukprot:Cvel_24428.t1-p1 / transcript=Cvel_24428.t1 / gene=Cvel_24428 / organism=Chromera_velia_CCMP2878 / gene_product=Cytokinesis protein sepH, putative / transcript_product=Cytokinesis protein sepH, putative / location=Cvel_scaffold2639:11381-16177(+) / protein_length=636 / sequence_SO=supercontig / SO=protein_coding / is_pseudo=false